MPADTSLRLKASKKLKLNIGSSEKNVGKVVKGQSSTSPKDDKFHKGWNRVKQDRDLKSSAESELMKSVRFGRKKKLAAKHDKDEDGEGGSNGNRGARNKKSFGKGKRQSENSFQSGEDGDESPRSTQTFGGRGSTISKAINSSRKVKNGKEKAQNSIHKLKTNTKGIEEMDDSENGLLKKCTGSKSSTKESNQSQNTLGVVSHGKSAKRKTTENRSQDGDSEIKDIRRKKKKPMIRIDPYDISNKRLDDDITITENVKKEKKEAEKSVGMSKNAQFRAIQPSQSILSFVEDNLLGRRRMIELRRAGYNTDLSAPVDNIPFSKSSERERIEENIFRNKLSFFAAANVSSSFPMPECPEIAFAGRSNVGKSSMLNALTRQWGVARTSDKPGLTQTINFFKLGSKLCLVDLPGYGFAYAKEEVKDAWEELVKEYVTTRVGLKQVCVLIDTKWGMKPRDHELIDLMERSQTNYQIVLTKTDLVFPIDVARRAMQIEESLKANKSIVQPVMMVSSKTGAGIRSLRTLLAKIARFAKV